MSLKKRPVKTARRPSYDTTNQQLLEEGGYNRGIIRRGEGGNNNATNHNVRDGERFGIAQARGTHRPSALRENFLPQITAANVNPVPNGNRTASLPPLLPVADNSMLQSVSEEIKVVDIEASSESSVLNFAIEPELFDNSENGASAVRTSTPTMTTPDCTIASTTVSSLNDIKSPLAEKVKHDLPYIKTDAWESVSEQPFCHYCGMGFKSLAFKARHEKFSALHQARITEVDKKTNNLMAPLGATMINRLEALPKPQNEGSLLYHGSKLFWRSGRTVELDMYHHVHADVVEVIAFEQENHKELNRIYLSYSILRELTIGMLGCERDNEDSVNKTPLLLEDETNRKKITSAILARIQEDKNQQLLNFSQLITDTKSPIVATIPSTVVPVSLNRRRKTTGEEFEQTLSQVQMDLNDLKGATSHAKKIIAIQKKAVQLFHQAGEVAIQKKHVSTYSLPRQRWVRAIDRVMVNTYIHKVHVRLAELQIR